MASEFSTQFYRASAFRCRFFAPALCASQSVGHDNYMQGYGTPPERLFCAGRVMMVGRGAASWQGVELVNRGCRRPGVHI